MKSPLIVALCGPTATGKTEVAMGLARHFSSEVINFDSVQVFKRLDIGSSKPTKEMLAEIPHHLIGIVEPDELFTAGDFKRQAENLITDNLKNSKLVILVGGTGFYLQALTKGMYDLEPIPFEIKAQLKEELVSRGREELFRELKKVDSAYAQNISINDTYRLLRGLEVWRGIQKTPTEIRQAFQKTKPDFKILQFGIYKNREVLKKGVMARTGQMLAHGLIDETQAVLKQFGMQKPLGSVGYKEVCDHLAGRTPLGELPEAIAASTMKLAKRQMTWFKRDQIPWFDTGQSAREIYGVIHQISVEIEKALFATCP